MPPPGDPGGALKNALPDSYTVDVRIGTRQDGELVWEPIKVQVEMDNMVEFQWRQKAKDSYPAALLAKPFKWSGEGIIQLDVKIQGHRAKAVYDPGCSGVGLSAAWAARHALGTSAQMPLTIASADGISTITREVYEGLQIDWKDSSVRLPAVVLPGAGFDVLLGMAWIAAAKVSLNADTRTLRVNGNDYRYDQLTIPAPPTDCSLVTIYAESAATIPPWETVPVSIQPFEQGAYGGYVSTELPAKTHCTAPLYTDSKVDGLLPPLIVQNRSDRPITIQRGEKVGTWTAAVLAEPHLVPNKDTFQLLYVHPSGRLGEDTRVPPPHWESTPLAPIEMAPLLFIGQVRRRPNWATLRNQAPNRQAIQRLRAPPLARCRRRHPRRGGQNETRRPDRGKHQPILVPRRVRTQTRRGAASLH